MTTHEWILAFDTALMRCFAIDHRDAGLTDTDLARYSDLPPEQAALQFGEDYDLDRVDRVGADARTGPSGYSSADCLTEMRAVLRGSDL
jgi:hypothetical protein